MEKTEKSSLDFRGGNGDAFLSRNDILENVSDVFGIASYNNIPLQSSPQVIHRSYSDNKAFWQDALNDLQFESMRVQLKGFHLTEWIPLAPGRYFTPSAESARLEAAQHFYDPLKKEYNLAGKGRLFLGGIGSVRLAAKTSRSDTIFFLGASSTGVSHQGIPIALYQPEYHRVVQIIKKHGGCLVNIVGTLRILPISLSLILHDRQVPKHCLVVDDIKVIRPSQSSQLSTTVSVMFQVDDRMELAEGWTCHTFSPSSSERTLSASVDWLQDYTRRYSRATNPMILSDFDEQYEHFANPVAFPISRIRDYNIDTYRAYQYENYYHIDIKTAFMGDKVEGNKSTHSFSGGQPIISNNIGSVNVSTSTNTYNNTNNRPPNPWLSGSYYLVVFLLVIGVICVAGSVLPTWSLPVVIIGSILALSVIGAFQLRQDEKLSPEKFIQLMTLSLRTLSFIKPPSQKPASKTPSKTDTSNVSTLPSTESDSTTD